MLARCKVCGNLHKLSKAHKDYWLVAKRPDYPFICDDCSTRIQTELQYLWALRILSQYPSLTQRSY